MFDFGVDFIEVVEFAIFIGCATRRGADVVLMARERFDNLPLLAN